MALISGLYPHACLGYSITIALNLFSCLIRMKYFPLTVNQLPNNHFTSLDVFVRLKMQSSVNLLFLVGILFSQSLVFCVVNFVIFKALFK
jgi:hypothetical protein